MLGDVGHALRALALEGEEDGVGSRFDLWVDRLCQLDSIVPPAQKEPVKFLLQFPDVRATMLRNHAVKSSGNALRTALRRPSARVPAEPGSVEQLQLTGVEFALQLGGHCIWHSGTLSGGNALSHLEQHGCQRYVQCGANAGQQL
jgi:hypothetical protein